MAAPTLEECTAFLQKPNASAQGSNVFGHVSEILLKLVEERPVNPVDVFEEVSAAVKQSSYNTTDAPLRPSYQENPSVAWAMNAVNQFTVKGPGEDKAAGGDEGCEIENLAQSAQLFEAAGIGLGSHEATCLAVGLRKLAEAEPLKSVRFWGKITGTQRDYLIAECTYTDPKAHIPVGSDEAAPEAKPGAPEPVPAEAIGEGLNKFVYYVVGYAYGPDGVFGHYTYDKWIKLPAVRPEQIMVARQIKKLFSGDLESTVNSYPPFPGKEAEYLAAQIARISRGATMTIEGLWSVTEDDETGATIIKMKEVGGEDPFEVKKTGPEGLTSEEGWKAAWVHHPLYSSILAKMGRCTWPVKPVPEGEDPPEDDEEKEEPEPLNKALDEEVGVGDLPPFSVRLATPMLGDFSPAVLSSTRWIGAHTVALETTCVNVYVGNGLKYTGTQPFQVVMPPALPDECSDFLPGEEGSEEPGPARPGMKEQVDEPMPDPFLVVDGAAEGGDGEEEA